MTASFPSFAYRYQEPERIELNLDNPIFVFYICVNGMSRQRAEEYIHQVKSQFDIYSNITMWIVTTDEPTKIECVYDGKGKTKDSEIAGLIEQINERITVLGQSNSFEDFKINIRDWRIDKIVKHLNEEDK
jgi:hypothetical protein